MLLNTTQPTQQSHSSVFGSLRQKQLAHVTERTNLIVWFISLYSCGTTIAPVKLCKLIC